MKLVIFGCSMMITGWLGFAIFCSAAVTTTYVGESLHFLDIWNLFGVTSIVWGFFLIGFVGFILAIVGVLIKKERGSSVECVGKEN